jgi:hypothetical protein
MKKIIKKKWINALRSGKFQQGTGCLWDSKDNSYCCLGVLCEITGNGNNRNMENDYPKDINPDDPNKNTIQPFLGLSANIQIKLASLNDGGCDFKEIANYISKNVKAED